MVLNLILFGLAAEPHIGLGKVLAWAYAKVWTLRGWQHFDHRFEHLRDPHDTCWPEPGILDARKIPRNGIVLDLWCGSGQDLLSRIAACLKLEDVLVDSATLPLAYLEVLLKLRFKQMRRWTSDWGNGVSSIICSAGFEL